MPSSSFEEQYFEDPEFIPGLKGGDEVRGYGYYPQYFPIVQAQIATLAELTGAASLLDVGCGKGALVAYARQSLQLTAVGSDLSQYATGKARRRRGGKLTVRASCTALPFPDQGFDMVWCNGVLQYLEGESAREALAEIGRVTRQAAFVSNIAHAERGGEWAAHDFLTRLYMRPAQWAALAGAPEIEAIPLPFEGESAILLCRHQTASLPLRFVEISLERMRRLGVKLTENPDLTAFRRRCRGR